MTESKRNSGFFRMINLSDMVGQLEDLITYFAQPEEDLAHEERQKFLRALKNRQDLFQEEGILNLILEIIDKMNVITAAGMLSSLAGEESGQQWEEVTTYLYQLLGNYLTLPLQFPQIISSIFSCHYQRQPYQLFPVCPGPEAQLAFQ